MRRLLYLFAMAAMLAACKDSGNGTVDSDDGEMNVTFDVNWSNMPTKPTGLTLCFYPLGGIGNDTIMHFDVVDKVSVTLPEQDYSVICFNQSETEFPEYKFDLSSYETASVSGVENSSLKAGTLAVASMNSVNSSTTRALNLMGVLKPTNVVRSMSLKVHVEGLRERVEVHGSLSNMCTGVTMCDRKPTAEVADLPIPSDAWKISVPDDVEVPTELTATFATFGILFEEEFEVTTRAASDIDLRNILHIVVKSEETGEIVYEDNLDVTEEVVEQYLAAVEAEAQQDITDAFFPMGYETKNVAAWYACESVETESKMRKVLAVFLFDDGTFITTKRKFEANGSESREIEASGQYSLTNGDYSNGEAVILMDSMEMNATIVSNLMTVYEYDKAMEDRFVRQFGNVPQAMSLTGGQTEGESADAFFPYGLEDYKVAAWYAYSSSSNGKEKVTAVYLFENNVFVTTRRTVDNGVETREIVMSGAYLFASGDYNSGNVNIYSEEGDSINTSGNMSATIENGVMTVYQNKLPMEEQLVRQTGAVPEPKLPTDYESELLSDAFFPEGYEQKTVAAWYGWSQYDVVSHNFKLLAVYLFTDNTFVTTKRKYEDRVETREIEASGRYEILQGDYSNGQADIYSAAGLDTMRMSVTIQNDVMTVYENGQAMEETFTRQYGDVPSALPLNVGYEAIYDAFYPSAYEKKTVSAWYAWAGVESESQKYKVLAVYLFDDKTFITTKRKWDGDGTESREIEVSGTYSIHTGNYSDGGAYIMVSAGDNTVMMTADIVNDVMTIYDENGNPMQETYRRQYIDLPSGMSETLQEIIDNPSDSIVSENDFSIEAIDLGLSVRWASANVGATSVESYGTYFAWGETSGYNSETTEGKYSYTWQNYAWSDSSMTTLTKYNSSERYGMVDTLTVLMPADDAATVNMGSDWRTPTVEEWNELVENCTWTWTTQNDENGFLVTAKNGNSIFLPAAGYFNEYYEFAQNASSFGFYWTSSLDATCYRAHQFSMSYSGNHGTDYSARNCGMTIRAVTK